MRDSNPRSPAGSKMKDEQIRKMNKNCKKSGPLRVRLSTEKKKLLTVRVGLFSLREKAPTKNIKKFLPVWKFFLNLKYQKNHSKEKVIFQKKFHCTKTN